MYKNIEDIIKSGIENYLESKKNDNINYHVLEEIFPVERRIRSIIGGLETSFGTRVWEPLVKQLASANGFNIKDEKSFKRPKKLPIEVTNLINNWGNKRENSKSEICLNEYINELRKIIKELNIDYDKVEYEDLTKGQGIDIWIEKDGIEYITDIKTTQFNASDGNKFNRHILNWYAYRISNNPDVNIKAFIAIPFNPFKKPWYNVMEGRAKPLINNKDIITDKSFWKLISGDENTYENIVKSFQVLKKENLLEKYKDVIYGDNIDSIDRERCEVIRLSNIHEFIEKIKNNFFEEEYRYIYDEGKYISYLSENYINVHKLNIDIHQHRYCFYDDTQNDYETYYINYKYFNSETYEYIGDGESIIECIDKFCEDYREYNIEDVMCTLVECIEE